MPALSNNRNNALGPWYVGSYSGPAASDAYNWGGRTPSQRGFLPLQKSTARLSINHSVSTLPMARHEPRRRIVPPGESQSPLKVRGAVGWKRPLEATRADKDADTTGRLAA